MSKKVRDVLPVHLFVALCGILLSACTVPAINLSTNELPYNIIELSQAALIFERPPGDHSQVAVTARTVDFGPGDVLEMVPHGADDRTVAEFAVRRDGDAEVQVTVTLPGSNLQHSKIIGVHVHSESGNHHSLRLPITTN
jgi:hypothetical protein